MSATVRAEPQALATTALLSDSSAAVDLRWRAPGSCIEVYRLRVDEQYRHEGVALFLGRQEEHRSWLLALEGDPEQTREISLVRAMLAPENGGPPEGVARPDQPLVEDDDVDASDEQPRFRSAWWGPRSVGPAAPDFACRRRTWDPFEDALALG